MHERICIDLKTKLASKFGDLESQEKFVHALIENYQTKTEALEEAESELEVVDDTQSEAVEQFQEKLKREEAEFYANLKEQRKNLAEDVEAKLKAVDHSSHTVVSRDCK